MDHVSRVLEPATTDADIVDSKKKAVLCNTQLQHRIPARSLLSHRRFPVKSAVTHPIVV